MHKPMPGTTPLNPPPPSSARGDPQASPVDALLPSNGLNFLRREKNYVTYAQTYAGNDSSTELLKEIHEWKR